MLSRQARSIFDFALLCFFQLKKMKNDTTTDKQHSNVKMDEGQTENSKQLANNEYLVVWSGS